MDKRRGDFTPAFHYAIASSLNSTNWIDFADKIASADITFSSFKERLNTFDLENRLYIVQKLEEQKPNITGATRRIRLNSFINSVKSFKPTSTGTGLVETNPNKPFWETGFGQVIMELANINTNPVTNGGGGTGGNVTTDGNNDLWKPDSNLYQNTKKKNNTVWWIVGGVLVTGVVVTGTILIVRAASGGKGKKATAKA